MVEVKGYRIRLVWLLLVVLALLTFSSCLNRTDKQGNSGEKQSNTRDKEDETTFINHGDENIIYDKYGTCYQVLLYSFCDSNADGIGDINGLISKLDYIKDLGFTSIWLLPINASTTYHKYDVVDYYQIDQEYGTMEDFEKLVKACNEKKIDLYMDFVINHTSAMNQWFLDAVNYIKTLKNGEEPDKSVCPYVDYYNFERGDSIQKGWSRVPGTENWNYECVFWDQMPDLNLDSSVVRAEIEKIASFWIDKGIKGFRLDAALHYYEGDVTKSTEAVQWFYDYVEGIDPDIYVVAEVWESFNTLQEFYKSGVDSLINFVSGNRDGLFVKSINRMGNGKSGANLSQNLQMMQETFRSVNPNYVDGVFLSNHDTGRAAGFLNRDEDKIKLAAGLEILSTGCVFVYYGEELGMSGAGEDVNKRAPMYWTDGDNVADMTLGPPEMVKQKHMFGSYEAQRIDSSSIYNYYKKAIHLRNKYPEIGRGTITTMKDVIDANGDVCAIEKEYNGKTIYVLYNLSKKPVTIKVSKDVYSYQGISDYLSTGEDAPSLNRDSLIIPAYGCVILQ